MKLTFKYIIFSLAYIALGIVLTNQISSFPTSLMILIQVACLAVTQKIELKAEKANMYHRETIYPIAKSMVLIVPFIMLDILSIPNQISQ